MKPYYSVLKLRFINGLQYRAAALAGMATQLFFGFIFIMIYVAFYSQGTGSQPISLKDIVAYIWLQQVFLAFVALYFRDSQIFQLITSGNIAYELCRPCGIYSFWFAKMLASRLSSAILRSFPILIVAFLLPQPYRMSPPPSTAALVLFLITLFLGLLLIVALTMLVHISVFWTMSPTGSVLMMAVIGEFMAGMIIPVPLMPSWVQQIAYALPFRWAVDLPFRVYSGQIPEADAFWSIGVQLVWLAALIGLGRLLMRRALRRVVVQGG